MNNSSSLRGSQTRSNPGVATSGLLRREYSPRNDDAFLYNPPMLDILLKAYTATDPSLKCDLTAVAYETLPEGFTLVDAAAPHFPGRPEKPLLVHPRSLPKRRLGTLEGRAALWHAIAHIEFNAINLALDAFLRFPGLPHDYYKDCLRIAAEEAYHFSLIEAHLQNLGYGYGAFPAHDSLWELAEKTASDPLIRMGLVPRVMEARGLDVTPGIMQKLALAGDNQAERILGIILRDEIGHVAVGNKWFKYLCEQRCLAPLETFEHLAETFLQTQLKGPYERTLREEAGFSPAELDWLTTRFP